MKKGDALFGSTGKICNVLWRSDVYLSKAHEVCFSDGSVIRTSESQIWLTETRKERRSNKRRTDDYRERRKAKRPRRGSGKRPDLVEMNETRVQNLLSPSDPGQHTTQEITKTLKHGIETNHSVNICEPLTLPKTALPIDPYVLGVWLSDGSRGSGRITGMDEEVFDECRKAGYTLSNPPSSPMSHTILGISGKLRELGILQDKYIPTQYLRASRDQRLALLQGLMDTDGTVDKHTGKCSFLTVYRDFANGMLDLLNGLGIKVVIRENRAKLNGKDYGPEYNFHFVSDFEVFRLPRKLRLQKLKISDRAKRRYVIDIRETKPQQMVSLVVDSPDHTFLVGNTMIPTHDAVQTK